MPAGSFVDRAVLPACYVRRHTQLAHRVDEVARVIGFVRSRRDPTASLSGQLVQTLIKPHRAPPCIRLRGHRCRDQPIPVLHQSMSQIAQLGFLACRLLIEPRFRVGARGVRLVCGATRRENLLRSPTAIVLAAKALLSRPGLDQRPSTVKCSSDINPPPAL